MGRFVLPLAQFITSTSKVAAGYKLYFYTTGTSTLLDTYSDSARTTPNSNPVIADANGLWDDIFLSDVPYKVSLYTSADVLVWSADPVQTSTGEIGIPVPIAKGGTNSTTAANARTALGLGTAATYTVGSGASEVPTNSLVSGMPTGGILMWYGSLGSVPAGYAPCDGGTYSKSDGSGSIAAPDLRDRFVIGATSTYAAGSSGGSAAGATTGASGSLTLAAAAGGDHNHTGATDGHTLTTSEIPAHNHQENVGQGSSGSVTGWNVVSNATSTASSLYTANNTGGGGSHNHGLQASGTHTHSVTGGDHTHSMSGGLPPYMALVFIMKL
jgi:hypothetical protein